MQIRVARRLAGSATAVATAAALGQITQVNVGPGEVLEYEDVIAGTFNGQTFELGPETLFSINSGGAMFFRRQYPDWMGSAVVLNDGAMSSHLEASNVTFDILDGAECFAVDALAGATVNLAGGSVPGRLQAHAGGTVHVTGGIMSPDTAAYTGGTMIIDGGAFLLDGAPIDDAAGLSLAEEQWLSGVLADGTVFVLSASTGDYFDEGTLDLRAASVPPEGPALIDLSEGRYDSGLRPGQTLRLSGTGHLGENFAAVGAMIEMSGGQVGALTVVDSNVNVTSGTIGGGLEAIGASEIVVSGGAFDSDGLGDSFIIRHGASAQITGGSFGKGFGVGPGGWADIAGGTFAGILSVAAGGSASVSGGSTSEFALEEGGSLSFVGGEFELDGQSVTGVPGGGLGEEQVLSGVLEDGHVLVVSGAFDRFPTNTIALHEIEVPPAGPAVIDLASGEYGLGLRPGQTLNLSDAGTLAAGFAAVGATLNVTGGTIGPGLSLAGSALHMTGGETAGAVKIYAESRAEISGGRLLGDLRVFAGGTAEITGGELLSGLEARPESSVHISGGAIQPWARFLPGSVGRIGGDSLMHWMIVNAGADVIVEGGRFGGIVETQGTGMRVYGGNFDDALFVLWGGHAVQMYVTEAFIDGVRVIPGRDLVLVDSDDGSVLEAVFRDGSSTRIRIRENIRGGLLALERIPTAGCAADWNDDGRLLVNDLLAFLASYRQGSADLNGDGTTDVRDLLGFLGAYRNPC